ILLRVTALSQPYTLSLHDALPISVQYIGAGGVVGPDYVAGVFIEADDGRGLGSGEMFVGVIDAVGGDDVDEIVPSDRRATGHVRSEEHTSELQSLRHLVCRLLLEK